VGPEEKDIATRRFVMSSPEESSADQTLAEYGAGVLKRYEACVSCRRKKIASVVRECWNVIGLIVNQRCDAVCM
jgi:hypothetical protein